MCRQVKKQTRQVSESSQGLFAYRVSRVGCVGCVGCFLVKVTASERFLERINGVLVSALSPPRVDKQKGPCASCTVWCTIHLVNVVAGPSVNEPSPLSCVAVCSRANICRATVEPTATAEPQQIESKGC